MSIETRRAEIAQVITDNLISVGVSIEPYKVSQVSMSGWLQISKTDFEGCTYGEVRLTVECLILVANDRTTFEKKQDQLTVPLIKAVQAAGGRAPVIQPVIESVGQSALYSLSAQFVTEAYTESEA